MDNLQNTKDAVEVAQVLAAAAKLKQQQNCPSRPGMIDALMAAWNAAPSEIANIENGAVLDMPSRFALLPDSELFSRLSLYYQGLIDHCRKKAISAFGENGNTREI